jgi:hypothetical protein
VKRNEAGKHLRTHGRWMRPAEKVVFLILLERSDNTDCTVPDFMTPSTKDLADMCGYTAWWTRGAITHLEKHGWIIRGHTRGGRGHKSTYQLAAGKPCDCLPKQASPPTRPEPPKQATPLAPFSAERGYSTSPERGYFVSGNGRSGPVSDEGHRRGRGKEGAALPPDWTLVRQLIRIVHADPCGGIHREELAERLRQPADGQLFTTALMIAYRRKQIDYCGQYVVKPIDLSARTAP